MAKTQIHGGTSSTASQIVDASIYNLQIAAAAAIDSTKLAAWSADRDANNHKLTNLTDPVNPQDAANLRTVQNYVQGLAPKGSVRVLKDSNISKTGVPGNVDSVTTLAIGDLILLTGQTTHVDDGPWIIQSGAWTRPANFDDANDAIKGAYWLVDEGTVYGGTGWLLTNAAGYVIDTTALTWTQIFGPGDIIAGAGLTQTGSTFDVVATDASITVNANDLQVHRDSGATTGCIGLSASGITVTVLAAGGLQITSNSLGIKLADGSLTLSGSGLSVTNPVPNFAVREVPTGTINGSNAAFVLAHTPTAGSEEVFLNGLLMQVGSGNDYTISAATITFETAAVPQTGDRVLVSYRY